VRGTLLDRLQQIVVITDVGGEQYLTVQDYSEQEEYEYWGSPFDEAVNGSLRQNLKGSRKKIELSYRLCTEPSVYRSICNNIATDLNNGREFVYIGIDNQSVFRVTLDSGFSNRVEYTNQHGLFIPKLVFKSTQLNVQIGLIFEDWRYVYEDVDEYRDYGLINDSVTTFIDYGSIT
jgi:hypothetical protein